MSWKENETCPNGTWKFAHLMNQGKPTSNYQNLSETTQQILNQMVPRTKLLSFRVKGVTFGQNIMVGHLRSKWRGLTPISTI